tara:strand:- start:499 stop:723 length:225 start_codon:yes stop_codon:yes gene_type:complete
MITVEMDMDETAITVLDTSGELEDVVACLYEDYCHIMQWNEKEQRYMVVTLKPAMYLSLMKSFSLAEGSYQIIS